jgi:hypothetical protein
MLLQTLVLIASLVLVSGAVMVSALAGVKAAFHQIVLAKTETAMSDATQDFGAWAAAFVAKNGTEQTAAAWVPPAAPLTESLCESAGSTAAAAGGCNLLATIAWKVTGSTTDAPTPETPIDPASVAENLAATVDEQRISATLSVRLTDARGMTVYATASREVTARLLDVAPYVVVTAVRDTDLEAGSIHATEGDSAGAPPLAGPGVEDQPNVKAPAVFTDTRIMTTVDCVNTSPFDQTDPASPQDASKSVVYSFHPWGNQGWAYEDPCAPTYYGRIASSPNVPSDLLPPNGTVYATNPDSNGTEQWQKKDRSVSSFPR